MEDKFLTEQALRKWKPVLDHSDMAAIADPHRRAVTATLLENQEKAIKQQIEAKAYSKGQSAERFFIAGRAGEPQKAPKGGKTAR